MRSAILALPLMLTACGDNVVKTYPQPNAETSDVSRRPKALAMSNFSFQTFDSENPCYSVRSFFTDFRRVYMPELKLRVKNCMKQDASPNAATPANGFKAATTDKAFVCPANESCVYSEIEITNDAYTDVFYAFHRSGATEYCEIEPKKSNPYTNKLPNSVTWNEGIRYKTPLINSSLHDLTDTYCSFFGLRPRST